MRIAFTVYGNPVSKGRPRVVRSPKGKVHAFTPEGTKTWEESIQGQALKYIPDKLLEGPLALNIVFRLMKPKSAPKREFPDKRPDLDNLVKAVKDALNGIMWRDDAQIVNLWAHKCYGDTPAVEIEIVELLERAKLEEAKG